MSERIEIPLGVTSVFHKIMAQRDSRIMCLFGGSSSSKTISALQYLTIIASNSERPLVFTIVGESLPVIKKTVLRDWQRIVMGQAFQSWRFNKNDFTYYFHTGSVFQFVSADDHRRFQGIRQDYAMIDEAYNIPRAIFDQIEIRTKHQLLLTWNPVSHFWGSKLEYEREDIVYIHSTYKDNKFLDKNITRALEVRARSDSNFYRVYVLGEYGTLEGLIFKEGEQWSKCDSLPDPFKSQVFAIDFGFSQDPAAILEIRYSDGQYWINEIAFETGLLNSDIHSILQGVQIGRSPVVADSAEPKSIAELRRHGLNIYESIKGPDSIRHGIKAMHEQHFHITKESINVIRELRNYAYAKNKDGEFEGKPVDRFNHGIDAARYGITYMKRRPNPGQYNISIRSMS